MNEFFLTEIKRLDTELKLIDHIIDNIEIKDRWLLDLRLAKQILRINLKIEIHNERDYFND